MKITMKEKTCKYVRLYYGYIFGAFTIVVGALFIWQVLSLYFAQAAPDFVGTPFTRERVGKALSKIALFFWLWVAGIVAGFVLWEVFPVAGKKRKICPDLQLARINKRMPSSAPAGLEAEFTAVGEAKRLIFAFRCAAWAMFGIAAVYGIVYLCIPSNFPGQDVTHEVLNMAKHIFPCIFAGLLVVCGAAVYEKYTVKRILPSAQKVVKNAKPAGKERAELSVVEKITAFFDDARVVLALRIAVGVMGVAFIIWGALNGNARAILIKAINICTECIGLG